MITEFIYTLKTPVSYGDREGEVSEGTFVTLTAPSYKQMDKIVPLKQAFYRAASEVSDTEVSDPEPASSEVANNDAGLTPKILISMLYQAKEVDMVKVFLYAVELFKSPTIAKIDGSIDMTTPLIEKLSHDDLEGMLGEYMVNFILASALNDQEQKSA